jgi:hypothetical protein
MDVTGYQMYLKFSFIASGVGLSPLYCGHFWPIVPAPDDRWGRLWNEDWQGKLKYSEKNLPQRHFVHHKSHLTRPRDRTRATAVGSQRLTTWAMAQPRTEVDMNFYNFRRVTSTFTILTYISVRFRLLIFLILHVRWRWCCSGNDIEVLCSGVPSILTEISRNFPPRKFLDHATIATFKYFPFRHLLTILILCTIYPYT